MLTEMQEEWKNFAKRAYGGEIPNKDQERQLIRTFLAGWVCSCGDSPARKAVVMSEVERCFKDFNWWPGEEWR